MDFNKIDSNNPVQHTDVTAQAEKKAMFAKDYESLEKINKVQSVFKKIIKGSAIAVGASSAPGAISGGVLGAIIAAKGAFALSATWLSGISVLEGGILVTGAGLAGLKVLAGIAAVAAAVAAVVLTVLLVSAIGYGISKLVKHLKESEIDEKYNQFKQNLEIHNQVAPTAYDIV